MAQFKEMTGTLEHMSGEQRIRTILELGEPDVKRVTSQFIEQQCRLKSFEQVSATSAKATYTFVVAPFYCNGSGNLHGGAQSMIYDLCTSVTLQAIGKPGWWFNGGVSRTLNVTYLRPAPEGTELELDAEIVAVGKTLAMLRGVIKRASDGVPISTCEHNKAAVASKPNWKL
ncbi:hypothetical protein LTR37_019915 [Vermiconidia calcicola]|uniref:Uncharacterized protein n=1 Tax=Vermiconidia calcicola TaxID=1690605 RepID=A0ACC3MCP1_9PEZI|nr:hypothetical protein LTR37_019915 [Vermiconidia calcicola]